MRHSKNTGSKGRSYGLLLLLAFSAAVFGVMTLHKLRDRRICSLFVKEKDRELNTLQLLLQVSPPLPPHPPVCVLIKEERLSVASLYLHNIYHSVFTSSLRNELNYQYFHW